MCGVSSVRYIKELLSIRAQLIVNADVAANDHSIFIFLCSMPDNDPPLHEGYAVEVPYPSHTRPGKLFWGSVQAFGQQDWLYAALREEQSGDRDGNLFTHAHSLRHDGAQRHTLLHLLRRFNTQCPEPIP
jgi:hypothetical protein